MSIMYSLVLDFHRHSDASEDMPLFLWKPRPAMTAKNRGVRTVAQLVSLQDHGQQTGPRPLCPPQVEGKSAG
ncbi:hypothetical protein ANANG_G00130940 [Anguilla anguilla]|uniref:Uncharacterized protein n=1 Tax=Anguilla anguilla TaxID=7936 RepID=A0A9D3MHA9_ANGAN|nr:hypothetical protein ANANG_G00130940 [Anguilla anguilla]